MVDYTHDLQILSAVIVLDVIHVMHHLVTSEHRLVVEKQIGRYILVIRQIPVTVQNASGR